MPKANSVIKCLKCGSESHIVGDLCPECGAPLAKVCGFCGFANSVPKNYCDQCGELLVLRPSKREGSRPSGNIGKPQSATSNLNGGDSEPKASARGGVSPHGEHRAEQSDHSPRGISPELKARDATKAEGSKAIPQEVGRGQPDDFSEPIQDQAPARQTRRMRITSRIRPLHTTAWARKTLFVLPAVLLIVAVCIIFAPQFPKYQLTRTAKRYLKELSAGHYENAYKMLSRNSRVSCSLKEYISFSREYYSNSPWKFKNVKPFLIEENAALVKYQIKEGNLPWKDDFISFTREDGKWVRPYIWNFFQAIEDAIGKNDQPQALFLAQRLYLTDPLDPRTAGYLCWTEYLMGLYGKAASSCKKALNNCRMYPVGFEPETVFWFHYQLADSLRNTHKYKEALVEYTNLLGIRDLPLQNRCEVMVDRADVFVWLNRYDAALQDMLDAQNICPPNAQKGVNTYLSYLTGDARKLAVALAKRVRFSAGGPALLDIRKVQLKEVTKKMRKAGKKTVPLKDLWISAHIAGPVYRIILRQKGGMDTAGRRLTSRDIYRLRVNLWTKSVKLEYSNVRNP